MNRPSLYVFVVTLILALGHPVASLRAEEAPSLGELQGEMDALRSKQAALVRQLLFSGDAAHVAWGATWARELSLTEVEPDLVDVLRRDAQSPGVVPHLTMLAVFDALIQLEVQVADDLLVPYVARDGVPTESVSAATVLAVRSGVPHTQLAAFDALDQRDGSFTAAWLALGNALNTSRGPAGFVARLVERLEVELKITVVDHDVLRGWGGSRHLMFGDGRRTLPSSYPPLWSYDLSRSQREGDQLLADGPIPIYLERRRVTEGFGSSRRSANRTRGRLAWIAARLGTDVDDLPLRQTHSGRVRWSDADTLLRDVEAEKAKVRRAHGKLVASLLERGVLSEGEARTLEPQVELTLKDDREDQSEPLPLPAEARPR